MSIDHSSPPSDSLKALAEAWGVATDLWDWQGRHVTVSAGTLRAVLKALGVAADSTQEVTRSLNLVADRDWRRVMAPSLVMRQDWTPWVPVRGPAGVPATLRIDFEDGSSRSIASVDFPVPPRSIDGTLTDETNFQLPFGLPLGWHTMVAELGDGTRATATLVVTPTRLDLPDDLPETCWGVLAQLYQARSAGSWGIGDFADLRRLAQWSGGDLGADFVLINPIHAAPPVSPIEPSPYLPTSRRFLSPLYLRVEDLPEYAALDDADRHTVDWLGARGRNLNAIDAINRDLVWQFKREALRQLFDQGVNDSDFDDYRRREGDGLAAFALWCALAEEHGGDWTRWPAALQDPTSEDVARFAADRAGDVDFHAWLQWRLDTQLADAQAAARAAGMRLGVVHDLAVGVHPHGADAWGLQSVLAQGVDVGAPPDQFNQLGQNWHQPPWHPVRLAEAGYRPFRDMLRGLLRDSGGIRIDHVIGLFRLWWVPEGEDPSRGACVRYDHEAMIGILALEAHRAGAVVIGEDLGLVEPTARDYLRDRGILGTSILWFEWDGDRPLPPERYRELCLASVSTHDLAPAAGYLTLRHVELRAELGLLTRPVAEERASEEKAIAAVRAALADRGLLPVEATDTDDVVVALHRYLAQTPVRLLGVGLADLVGDPRIINQPGTCDEYLNWRLPLAGPTGELLPLEAAEQTELPGRIARALRGD